MAINTWRYVVTWGYRNPDGTIVEETQWVPWETIETADNLPHFHTWNVTFSPAETLKLSADWYYNQWDTILWDAYSALWNWSNVYSDTANKINSFYDLLANDVTNRESRLGAAKYDLANKLNQDLLSQKDYIYNTFWPNGTLTNEINTYYDDLWNYLATDAGRQAAKIAAQWIHSWASLWAIRAQQNEAYNESFARYVQAKEQEINAKQQIAANLINYMSTLRKEYWDTTNQYIIQQYQRANDLLNTISQSIANSNIEIASAKLGKLTGWNGSNSSWVIVPASLINKYYSQLSDKDKATFDSLDTNTQYNIVANWNYNQLLNSSNNSTNDNKWGTDVIIWWGK